MANRDAVAAGPIVRYSTIAAIMLSLCTAPIAPVGVTPASAQTSPGVIARERLDQKPVPVRKKRRGKPRVVAAPPPPPAIVSFQLEQVVLEGSSLPAAKVEAVWRPFVGQLVDGPLLKRLSEALASLYARSDIALYSVVVPAQTSHGGQLRMVATEGYVAGVTIEGTRRRTVLKAIEGQTRRLLDERPLSKATLDRVQSLLDDMPGIEAKLTLQPDAAFGATRLLVAVKDKPVTASLSVDGRGIALLGKTHAQFDVQGNSLFRGGDQLRVAVLGATGDDTLQYQGLSYALPIGHDGTRISANVARQRTWANFFLLDGRAKSFGAQISHPLRRGTRRSLIATLGVDGIDSHNALMGFTLSNDRVRAVRLAGGYVFVNNRRLFSVGLTASQGLSVLGARTTPGQAVTDFRKLSIKVNASQALGANTALRAALFGQVSADNLPASEQISLGGDEFGRAYEASTIGGDAGAASSLELAWRPTRLPPLIAGSEFYVFGDAGRVRYHSRFGRPADQSDVASVGGGARLLVAQHHVLEVEVVRGLTNPVFYADKQKTRAVLSLRSTF